ncbi:hypothetical protein I3843_05G132500 [Carya illinoinensis]|uniref:Uncharacterized protein n=1 Tax=Carya illinoinensis TaxID=32201 RepID=A0A8T1QJC5_CARIL|nr:uncharacterized protein LOC122308889 [Carya illinoinensis]KAG2707361.1 hypothetical protein I3760_05G145300 [Carya illinoinensis]KAG2707362.1 hypothetical protein I3760_05G145300 [Carya illinoinensis]KAG6654409.1 hypothetical protein CIPAW_05G143700 [Carya illinoinensis]KAG6713213.1 hypothetical protein I3842_05G141200 [Carya illinoinensis]KAG6713214.1 hypothetical protein I3842_05G141200 [Carya illinoinensis]
MFPNSPLLLLVFLSITLQTLGFPTIGGSGGTQKGIDRRFLLSFRETPRGSNATYNCDPSGLCVPCLYSEKNDVKYRCSETGYRIPFKCLEIEDNSKDTNVKSPHNSRSTLETSDNDPKLDGVLPDAGELTSSMRHRGLLVDPSAVKSGLQAYITYRSCMVPVSEEKLSVLGFEGIVLCLFLIGSSVVYFRRKRTTAMTSFGGGRIQTNSRF